MSLIFCGRCEVMVNLCNSDLVHEEEQLTRYYGNCPSCGFEYEAFVSPKILQPETLRKIDEWMELRMDGLR